MISVIEKLINSHNPKNCDEAKNILREIIQSIVLIGLSRGGFFEKASFYGGTALRIFYDLNRFSEDLDFTLNEKDNNFSLEPYFQYVKELGDSYGLELILTSKEKKIETPIESAFAKLNTYNAFISLKLDSKLSKLLHKDEYLKVKFEVDCNPSEGFNIENKWIDKPEFAPIVTLDAPSLFAGKIHAILCRTYKDNVKGRDYYDFLFYISKGISVNLKYLQNKLIDSNVLTIEDDFDICILKQMLIKRFEKVDFEQVKSDASKFLIINENLSFYTKDLFIFMTNKIK